MNVCTYVIQYILKQKICIDVSVEKCLLILKTINILRKKERTIIISTGISTGIRNINSYYMDLIQKA